MSLPEITGGVVDLPVGVVTGGTVATSTSATSVTLTPDVIGGLLDLTVGGSHVETVEISTDGKTWHNALLGNVALPAEAKTMSVRLTAANGTQTVINHEIDRSVPVVVTANDSTESRSSSTSNFLSYWWVLLILLVLVGIAKAAQKKRAA